MTAGTAPATDPVGPSFVIVCDGPVPHRFMNFRGDVLARALAAWARVVHIVCPVPDDGAGDVGAPGIRFYYLHPFRRIRTFGGILNRLFTCLGTAVAVSRLLRREQVDCVRTISTWPTLSALLARGGRSSPPIVANLSDFYGDLYRGAHLPLPSLAAGVIARLERFAVRADVVIVDTAEQRDRWVSRRGLEPRRCAVIPHGLPRSGEHLGAGLGIAPRIRSLLGIPDDVPVILHLGDIGEMDGVDLLIRAAGRLRPDSQVAVLLVGQGAPPYVSSLHALATDLGVEGDVHWLERVPNAGLPALFDQVDVCVAPFRIRDTSSTAIQNKVLEYLTSDRPIVATGGTALENVIGDAATYFLADDLDSLTKALAQEIEHGSRLRPEQAARRQKLRTELSWLRIIEQETTLLRAALSGDEPSWQAFDYVIAE